MNNKHYIVNIFDERLNEYLPINAIFESFEEAEDYALQQGGQIRISELIIAKSRNGNTGTAFLNFEGKQMEFLNRRYGE